MIKTCACVLALAGAFAPFPAAAWGNHGHRAVGAIADQLIKGSNAQRQVAALLQAGESLEKVAVWADCVKGTYCGAQTAEMLEYTAANPKHSQYHYTDIPFQHAHYHDGAVGSAGNDIVQTLKQTIAVLQGRDDAVSNPRRFSRRQALLLLTHLAGDIHLPLHVGAAYVGKDGGFVVPGAHGQIDAANIFDARGGNNLLLDDAKLAAASAGLIPPAPAPLDGDAGPASKATAKPFHSYWDTTVVDYAMRRVGARTPQQFAQIVIGGQPVVAANTGAPAGWPYQWADDALQASKLAYADVTPGQTSLQTGKNGDSYKVWALEVPQNYPVPSSALAKAQLIKGGYHLAALLRAIWP
ncbi:hypothetical protein ACFDR9_003049 [Janthinobacterium sp. CG_23.3]|uniref:S1/P1 nuclease n=1 Tax=Janthinobacterium sp. CG_23.3 TaxID=3349634 RepID=UPI0038D43300